MSTSYHIAIDASRTTVNHLTGTEHYARELIRQIVQVNETRTVPHQITLFYRDNPPPDVIAPSAHVIQRIVPFPRLWTHLRFAAELWRSRPDVTFVPAHTLPAFFPGRSVVTVHDLGYRLFPQAHPPNQRRYLDLTTRYSASRATAILADSQATADDLTRFYGTSPDKISVVYPGVTAPPIESNISEIRQQYGLPLRYFLFIGTLQPRKNIARIVDAFDRWQKANPSEKIALVLAGKQGWLFDQRWLAGVDNVYITGYIDDAHKGALMAGATALIFPTLYEGFGFPVIEAMHCGTPVIASTSSSLPELVDSAGLLVDPENVSEIATAIDLIVWNADLRNRLRMQGYQQARQFTWERAAEQALTVLEQAASK